LQRKIKVARRVASRAQQGQGTAKNKITSNRGSAPIIVVKLLRTDTTLDLSQKGQSGKDFRDAAIGAFIVGKCRVCMAHGPTII
jgi:hypothetical protein